MKHRGLIARFLVVSLLGVSLSVVLAGGSVLADEGPLAAAEWEEVYGGTHDDRACSVQQTSDGGYIVVGTKGAATGGDSDIYLIKTDESGSTSGPGLFEKTFDGSFYDEGWSVQQTWEAGAPDGYIIAGITYSSDGGYDVWLIKTDLNGDQVWVTTIGGVAGQADKAYSVRQTKDGGYIVAGQVHTQIHASSDVYLGKTDSNGNVVWEKTFGGMGLDVARSVRQTDDGGYIVVGQTYSEWDGESGNQKSRGSSDVYLIKTDANGVQEWYRIYGWTGLDIGYSVEQTSDGGYIVAGALYVTDRGYDFYLLKTDSAGIRQWTKWIGGPGNDIAYSVKVTSDGGYVIVGETSSYGSGAVDAWLVKTDAAGNVQWDQTFGGFGADLARSVFVTKDGYIIAGETSSYGSGDFDAWVIKVSNPPMHPTNLIPADGAEGLSVETTLTSSPFVDPDDQDSHAASQWQITATRGDYSDPVYDSLRDTENKTTLSLPEGYLAHVATYYWRVRYQDNHGAWSAYSSETSFSTASAPPEQPGNVWPIDGAGDTGVTPELKSSPFVDPEIGDKHAASEWQITSTSGDYSNPTLTSGRDTQNLTSYKVSPGKLRYDTTYYWHVRHQDSQGIWSDWSEETSFSTGPVPAAPVAAFSASPTSGDAPLNVQFTDESTGVIDSYAWDFDSDGTVDSTARNPTQSFGEGVYSVTLTVTGPGGSDTEEKPGYIEATAGGGLGTCGCAPVSAAPSPVGLMIGWSVAGVTWGAGYYLVRRAGKGKNR